MDLCRLLLRLLRKRRRLILTARFGGISIQGYKMTTVINDLQKYTLSVTELNAAGAQVPVAGVPVWVSSNEAVATVLAAADGLSANITCEPS